ncbi:hypothetical protein [Lentimicrobium sp. S6]|uniref:hypothetical protein n=1 Tax=Lentimicrobium sp. S6 TaxID=2735872 RepID=UPI00155666B2|nr:hypothetical protein [Lentimicrobium sp. S6]NPD47182.1 hypothetical protein [Lentimicrobium sp. S6]
MEEIEIINQTLVELLSEDWYYEKGSPPPKPLSINATKIDSAKYIQYLSEYEISKTNKKIDTSRLIVILKDSLIAIPSRIKLGYIADIKYFKTNYSADTSFISLIKKLKSFTVGKPLNTSEIKNIGRFDIIKLTDLEHIKKPYGKIGYIRYSKVAFDSSHRRACVYFDFNHTTLFGYGTILFLEKSGTKWTIIGQFGQWVS